MAKLKAGEKVVQKFEVTIKFTAEEGDKRVTVKDIKEEAFAGVDYFVVVKEVKESVE